MTDLKNLYKLAPKFGEPKALKRQVRELEKRFFDKTERQPIDAAQVTRKFWALAKSNPERLATEFTRREIGKLSWGLSLLYENGRIVDDFDTTKIALELILRNYRTRYLHGLAYSFFNAYSPEQSEGVGILKHVFRQRLQKYDGYNKTLKKWRDLSDILLASSGHRKFAEYVIKNELKYENIDETFNIPKGSNFWSETINVLVDVLVSKRSVLGNLKPLLDFLTENNEPSIIKHAIEKLLLYYKNEEPENINRVLYNFVLNHLRDPRLRNNPKWIGIDKDAKRVFTRWLSVEDLEMFFDAIAVDRDRKEFWLQYVNEIQYSRVIIGRTAKSINHQLFKKFLWQRRHSELKGGQAKDSAFIMKIDRLIVVEFSGTGNACYFYHEKSVPFSLGKYQYYLTELKDPEARKHPSESKFKLDHRGDWQYRFENKLRWNYGITIY